MDQIPARSIPDTLMPLDFNTYQEGALATAIYPEQGTGSILALAYVALGLGEAGEVQGKIKKIMRDCGGELSNERRIQIAAELGDVLWYVAMTAVELGLDFESVAMMNLEKLAGRQKRGVLSGSGDNR